MKRFEGFFYKWIIPETVAAFSGASVKCYRHTDKGYFVFC